MNKDRRAAINEQVETLENLRGQMADVLSAIETIYDEEQEYVDNMPESLQSSERGEAAATAAINLENAKSSLESLDSEIGDAIDYLNSAAE